MRKTLVLVALVLFVLVFSACGGDDSDKGQIDGDIDGDSDAAENTEDTEGSENTENSEDGGEADEEVIDPACLNQPEITVDSSRRKFAVNLFHYNIQYVAGGLEGYGQGTMDDLFDYDEQETEDLIITIGFEPILKIYEENPQWHVTFEMQGLMIEAIRERHPEILERLRTLVHNGTAEVISWHFSDQLFLAYPRHNMEWSIRMNDREWINDCIPRGGGVFTQEGQFGEGMIPLMQREDWALGPYNYGLYANNTWNTFVGKDVPAKPWYTWRDMDIFIVGRDVDDADSGIQTKWTYFDDGELLAAGYGNPYLGDLFKVSEDSINKFKEDMQKLEEEGYAHLTVREYQAHLAAIGVEKAQLPAILDATWQPHETGDFFLWMGEHGGTAAVEDDNNVLTTNYATQNTILAAEKALAYLETQQGADAELGAKLDEAKREILKAEVSDSTGWRPWKGEIEYSLEHAAAAQAAADAVIDGVKEKLGWEHIRIEPATGTVSADIIAAEAPDEIDAQLELEIEAGDRQIEEKWYSHGDGVSEVRISFGTATAESQKGMTPVTVRFPFESDLIEYSPALTEDEVVSYSRTSFPMESTHLPLSNGLIKLSADKWLIKNCFSVHLAPMVPFNVESAVGMKLAYIDNTLADDKNDEWSFYVVEGDQAKALEWANRINTFAVYQK